MIFSSTTFVFLFLPIVFLLYYIAKDKYKNMILLLASLIFYAYGEPKFVIIMIFSITVNWVIALKVSYYKDKEQIMISKIWLLIAIFINLALLFVFKYLDFTITSANRFLNIHLKIVGIALPIGISFYTFQAMSYVIDVYRDAGKAQKNILNVGLYISFFPQLVAGPIVRYETFSERMDNRKVSLDDFSIGVKRFICGFCKKIILANNLSVVAEKMFGVDNFALLPAGYAWIGAIAYTLQIYYDFAGYSDMAIGLGRMFGFTFPENFNYPYIAYSITDFWRRWHISLSQWFRDYVYIPLGGSRVKVIRHIFNMFVVWGLTGLWHGANYTFIIWGMIYFVFLVIEKYFVKPEQQKNKFFKVIWRVVTLEVIIFAWVFFKSSNLSNGIAYCKSMLGLLGNPIWNDAYIFNIKQNLIYMIMGIIYAVPIAPYIGRYATKKCKIFKNGIVTVIYICAFLWAVSFLILGAHNPFIYFNF